MSTIGIFFGSSTGNTSEAAKAIGAAFDTGTADIIDVSKAKSEDFSKYQYLILGTSTWGMGDLQDDWDAKLGELSAADIRGKKIALFGLGDQNSFTDTFVDGMAVLYEKVNEKGAIVTGFWPVNDYDFGDSQARKDDHFVGLVLDNDNQSEKTNIRISKWVELLKSEFV
jgi:flavodoxin I